MLYEPFFSSKSSKQRNDKEINMASLEQIRAMIKAQTEKEQAIKDGTFTGERQADSFLAFWNIPDNTALNLRFLPDGDVNNPFFWRERDMIRLTFNGVVGGTTDTVSVQVPCNEMWVPKSCPILNELRQWYTVAKETGDKELEKRASSYWKKKSYLMQCIVAPGSCEVKNDIAPENPIRRVLVNKDIFTKVKSILMNPGVSELPTHYERGRDFIVIKGKNGSGHNNYDQSQFSMGERVLNEQELSAIDQYGLFDLGEFMPKQPTAEELQAIAEMFEASVDGKPYDPSRWAQFYRPAGVQKPQQVAQAVTVNTPVAQAPVTQVTQAPVQAAAVTQVTETAEVQTVETPAAAPAAAAASDLVARLRARNSGQ